jgi:large subunit ribosomal protein L3
MLDSVFGKKVGMTQVFDKDGNVTPVTVVDVTNWFVTQLKTSKKDGYAALQVGFLRKGYQGESFSADWLKKKNDFFMHVKELCLEKGSDQFEVGQVFKLEHVSLNDGDKVDVVGTSRGLGFQGVVKRLGFRGGPAAHGSKFHRRPGASGCLRTQGEVMKGRGNPGQTGFERVTVEGLKIVHLDKDKGFIFVKGALPGKKDSLVLIKKQSK